MKNSADSRASHWSEGRHRDAIIYLLIAIFLLELAVGGVAVIYGIIHSEPLTPGGPPMARFPWLGWAVAALLMPVGLLLVLHLSGLLVSRTLDREADGAAEGGAQAAGAKPLPQRVDLFYRMVRHAPTVVILLAVLGFGGLLLFVDGLVESLGRAGMALLPYLPWIAGSVAVFLTVCYAVRQFFLYRHHRMEQEFAFRHAVLERTGVVLLPDGKTPLNLPAATGAGALPPASSAPAEEGLPEEGGTSGGQTRPDEDDIVDADIAGQSDDAPAAPRTPAGSGTVASPAASGPSHTMPGSPESCGQSREQKA